MYSQNDILRNNDPYEGEGNIIIAEVLESEYKCLHVDHEKHIGLNGSIEVKSHEAVHNSYHLIEAAKVSQ